MSAAELPPPALPPTEPDKPSWWKRRLWKFPVWVWLIAAFVLLGAIGNLTEKDKEDQAAPGTTSPVSALPATTLASNPTTLATTPATTSGPSSATTPPTEPPVDSVPVMAAWYQTHGDLLETTLGEMDKASAAARNSNIAEAERASRVVGGNMDVLARSLAGESDPAAIATRNAFDSCAVAYDAAANALSDFDSEAISAATSLINECTSAMQSATAVLEAG